MFADLMNRLLGEAPQADPEQDYGVSLAALLVRCARIDNDYDPAERDRIDRILKGRYGLTPPEAEALRRQGEVAEAEAGDTVHLTRVIKDGVPYEERGRVVEALWQVALADEDRDYTENAFLRLAVKLLGVNDVDSARARQRAEAVLRD